MPDSPGSNIISEDYGRLVFQWEVHPLKKNTGRLILFLITSLVFFLFLMEITRSLILAYLAFLIYLFTLKSFIFKTYYRLYEKGLCKVQLGFSENRSYSAFRKIFNSNDSILLATVEKYSFLAKTRGIELVFEDPELKNRVAGFLEDRIAEDN